MSFFLRALSAAALLAALLSAALAVTASAADRQGEIRLAQGNPPGAKGAQAGDPDEEPGAKKKKKKGKQGPPEGSEGQGGGGPPPGAPPGAKKEFQKGPPSQGFTPGTPQGGQQGQKKIAPTKKDAGKGYIGPKPAGQQTETQKSLTKKKTIPGTPQGGTAGAPPGGQAPAVTTSPKTIKPVGPPAGQPVNGTLKAQGTPKKPGIGPLAPVKGVPPKKIEKPEERVERSKKEFDAFKKRRRETVEKGGKRIVIEEPGKRKIIKEGGKIIIRHDENERFRRIYRNARVHRRVDGSQLTIILRPGGTEVFTEVDMYGRPLRRWRRYPDGTVVVLFDNRSYYRRFGYRRPDVFNVYINLGPPVIRIPRERYIVAFEDSPDDIVYETLIAPPVDPLDRTYSLEEIRYNRYLRERMRRLDLNTISFDFGSWEVDPDQYPKLERLARIINRILEENPDEMLMIEGYTDAVGSEEDNLSLSDRRAEEVAVVLTETYGVPPENLTTQGYGEQFLRVETDGPSVANRYVAVRRITPLLAR